MSEQSAKQKDFFPWTRTADSQRACLGIVYPRSGLFLLHGRRNGWDGVVMPVAGAGEGAGAVAGRLGLGEDGDVDGVGWMDGWREAG